MTNKPTLPSAKISFMEGHNSGAAKVTPDQTNATGVRLRSFIERIERLIKEMDALKLDIKEVFGEAKAEGWDVKIMRQIIKIRAANKDDLAEEDAILETYKTALGM